MKEDILVDSGRSEKELILIAFTSLYLVFPTIFFAYGWLKYPYNVITIFGIGIFFVFAIREIYQRLKSFRNNWSVQSTFILPFVIIAIWLSLSGIGGLGFQNGDYDLKNTLLRSLIIEKWPLSMIVEGVSMKVVYHLAYYLPAAAIGKLFGWIESNAFMFLWSFLGVMLAFFWFVNISRIVVKKNSSSLFYLTIIFCLAGGLDFVGAYFVKDMPFSLIKHIDNWAWHVQYSSQTTLMYWVPQHSIPAWLLTGMVVSTINKAQSIKYIGISVAASILWSPFAIVGIFPYLIVLGFMYLLPENRKFIFNRNSLIINAIAIWMGSIFLLYIASNNFSFPMEFIWNDIQNTRILVLTLLQFWFLEFGFLVFLIFAYNFVAQQKHTKEVKSVFQKSGDFWMFFSSNQKQHSLFLLSIMILFVLPFFKMGIYNDLVMRSSIPALFIFWSVISKILVERNRGAGVKLKFLYTLISITVFVGFLSSFAEMARSIEFYQFGPPDFYSVREIGAENNVATVMQRAGRDDTFFYHYLGK